MKGVIYLSLLFYLIVILSGSTFLLFFNFIIIKKRYERFIIGGIIFAGYGFSGIFSLDYYFNFSDGVFILLFALVFIVSIVWMKIPKDFYEKYINNLKD
jgi:hypothetical protein